MNLAFNFEGDPGEPISRGEFAEAMQILTSAFQQVATKTDLEQFATKSDLQQFATKTDLQRFATRDDLQEFATKADLEQLSARFDQRFATKDDLHHLEDRLSRRIDEKLDKWGELIFEKIGVAVQDHQVDMGAATREHAEAMQERQDQLEMRVTAVERHLDLPPAV